MNAILAVLHSFGVQSFRQGQNCVLTNMELTNHVYYNNWQSRSYDFAVARACDVVRSYANNELYYGMRQSVDAD